MNKIRALPEYPEVPRSLYLGFDNANLLKLFPLPPAEASPDWALPYSVRSFVYQASRALGGCHYWCSNRGSVYGEAVFNDLCDDPERADDLYSEPRNCHILAGWAAGQSACPLWNHISGLCQNDVERKFLYTYLRYVKDRQFPMLIPQARIGIAERRRPDFVVFVPLQFWKFKWVAIELDGAHPEGKADDDRARDKYYEDHKYEVISLRPGTKGYFEEARSLVESIDEWMAAAEVNKFDIAIRAEVTRTEKPDESPF